jgi:hypothetical protein
MTGKWKMKSLRTAWWSRVLSLCCVLQLTQAGCNESENSEDAQEESSETSTTPGAESDSLAELKKTCPLKEMETIIEKYFVNDYLDFEKYEATMAEIEQERTELDRRERRVGSNRQKRQEMDAAWDKHNEKVDEFNVRTEKINELVAQRNEWESGGKHLNFNHDVNQCLALLQEMKRDQGSDFEWKNNLDRIRTIRTVLGDDALRAHSESDSGHVLVTSMVKGERLIFLYDTGASTVTLSPPLVDVLDWTEHLGEESSFTLADGTQSKGRRLMIPSLTIAGQQRESVEAYVTKRAPGIGIDGLLGQSFIKHYHVTLRKDPGGSTELRLKPR